MAHRCDFSRRPIHDCHRHVSAVEVATTIPCLLVTKHLLGDLWFLAAPRSQRKEIYNVVSLMQAELEMISMRMEEMAAPRNQQRDPLQGIKLVETLKDLYDERILQEQFSVCAPCVHAIKKVQKKQLTKKSQPFDIDIHKPLIGLEISLNVTGESERTRRNLHEKLVEVLRLQNLNAFVNKRYDRMICDRCEGCCCDCLFSFWLVFDTNAGVTWGFLPCGVKQ